ncbi:AP-5 complex subunit zeta-1 isoform X2 [Phyllopteryx taeniolatus]|uniref:AP-5 complex subunit zeta-1 isoform X2 n=1 Tax=Phyllopteryx taeniolatus TaxID=161469 RepID=UPI002AD40590|nr:AP-5 complex subunit zeta-1 isoform X2 [Phyllopteryx taeniolatus]
MYSHGSESLIKQAREIQESELQKFYSRLMKLLQGKDHGHETVDSLERLRLILSATKYTRTLPPELQKMLLSLLSSPLEQLQVLSSAVLRETLALGGQAENYGQDGNSHLSSHKAALLLSQAESRDDLSALCTQLLRSLESRPSEGPTHSFAHTLPIVNTILTYSPESLTEDNITLLSKKLVDWLRYASTSQGGGASSGGFFTGSRSRQPLPIAELDGTVSGDFFTVLCVNQGFTEDQWMNVYSFSMLRHWLLTFHSVSGGAIADTDDRSEIDGSVVSMVSATSTSSRLLPPKEHLREKAFQYCQRLIEQCDRKAQKKTDTDLQKACLVEAVCILDCVCIEDASFVYRVFPCIKALFGRLSSDLSFARVLLPVAQFYLNHGELAAVDCDCVWNLVFGRFPAELFNDPFLAHELLRFLRLNLENVQLRVPQYTRHFPNLFKFLAWDSPAVVDDFVDLLPSMVTSGTALELLHTLLDLPCLSATLVLQLRSMCLPISDSGGRSLPSMDAFRNPSFRALFLFLLRGEAGSGDTIDRLSVLLELLSETANWPRVVQCAQTVPILLHIFFNTVITVADKTLLGQVILVLLERSSLLLNIPKYNTDIHRVFSRQLMNLCKLHPSLVMDQSHELLEFAGATSNVYGKQEIYTHVVLVLGDYLSVSYDSRCSVRLITYCFETLEAVLFEITSSAPPPGAGCPAPRVITSLMSALAKLASRSHDLIPRVSLFLSKLRNVSRGGSVSWCDDEEDLVSIITLGEELCALLKTPGVAQSVLNPPPHVTTPQWHQDTNVALPLQLRALTRLTQAHTSHAKSQHTPTSPSPYTST